jgi:hypothetical protein
MGGTQLRWSDVDLEEGLVHVRGRAPRCRLHRAVDWVQRLIRVLGSPGPRPR